MTPLFRTKAVWITHRLLKDIPAWHEIDCFACIGNLGHECGGFAVMQEIGQTPPNGGWGWSQWTGPRRRAFEAWCKAQNLDPASDEANYGYLLVELKGSEAGVVQAVARVDGLYSKVVAFEANFERAGVKNYASRYDYATQAQQAWSETNQAAPTPAPAPSPAPTPPVPPAPVPEPPKPLQPAPVPPPPPKPVSVPPTIGGVIASIIKAIVTALKILFGRK